MCSEPSIHVLHACVWLLDRFVECLKIWRFWAIFASKLIFSYFKILCKSNKTSWTYVRHGIEKFKHHTCQGRKFGYHWGTIGTQHGPLDWSKSWWNWLNDGDKYVSILESGTPMVPNFWCRMTMETVDTAFESLDLVLFENNLGTIGVPLSSIKTHLWPSFDQFHRLFLPIQGSILGTNCTPMVPKVCLRKSMMFELFNAVSHACSRRFVRFAKYLEIWEYQFSCKNCSKSSNFQTLYKSI